MPGRPGSTPVQVKGPGGAGHLTGVAAIAAGDNHSLALKADGTVWAWGYNSVSQLGDGTTMTRTTPVQVKGPGGAGYLTGVAAIAAGNNHSLALKADGTVWAWGHNTLGQLGDGTTTNRATPAQVKGAGGVGHLTGVAAIAAGENYSLALKTDGTVWGWGYNSVGQLGDGTTMTRTTPVQAKGPGGTGYLTGVAAIAAGNNHSLAVKADGTVWAWGYNPVGQLGDGTMASRITPVQVRGPGGVGSLNGVAAIAAGEDHSLAVKADGTVWAWGYNSVGQLGDGTVANRTTPVQAKGPGGVGHLAGVAATSAGGGHSLAVKADGTVLAWGYNPAGQLGDGTAADRTTPVRVSGLTTELRFVVDQTRYAVDGSNRDMDVAPVIKEGRTFLPIRFVAEPLGATVAWDGAERKVTITQGDKVIQLWIDNPQARVNGSPAPIDPGNPLVKPILHQDRTMLPLRFVAENLGAEVVWDAAERSITIVR